MSTTASILIGTFLLVTYAISFLQYNKARRSRERKQQIPLIMAILLGPLLFFMLSNNQRRERRQFMSGKRRFS